MKNAKNDVLSPSTQSLDLNQTHQVWTSLTVNFENVKSKNEIQLFQVLIHSLEKLSEYSFGEVTGPQTSRSEQEIGNRKLLPLYRVLKNTSSQFEAI